MGQCASLRRPHVWVLALCGAVVIGRSGAGTARPVSAAGCATQVNDSQSTLLPCITQFDLWSIMQDFEGIAKANLSPADGHPSRNSGEPGYKASADYVKKRMEAAGYDVTA